MGERLMHTPFHRKPYSSVTEDSLLDTANQVILPMLSTSVGTAPLPGNQGGGGGESPSAVAEAAKLSPSDPHSVGGYAQMLMNKDDKIGPTFAALTGLSPFHALTTSIEESKMKTSTLSAEDKALAAAVNAGMGLTGNAYKSTYELAAEMKFWGEDAVAAPAAEQLTEATGDPSDPDAAEEQSEAEAAEVDAIGGPGSSSDGGGGEGGGGEGGTSGTGTTSVSPGSSPGFQDDGVHAAKGGYISKPQGVGYADGGDVQGFMEGPPQPGPVGPVEGPGGPTDDAVPAELPEGTFVLNAKAVKLVGIKKLNDLVNKAMEALGPEAFIPPSPQGPQGMGGQQPQPVPVNVSNGEWVLSPPLVTYYGLEFWEKMNDKGLPKGEKSTDKEESFMDKSAPKKDFAEGGSVFLDEDGTLNKEGFLNWLTSGSDNNVTIVPDVDEEAVKALDKRLEKPTPSPATPRSAYNELVTHYLSKGPGDTPENRAHVEAVMEYFKRVESSGGTDPKAKGNEFQFEDATRNEALGNAVRILGSGTKVNDRALTVTNLFHHKAGAKAFTAYVKDPSPENLYKVWKDGHYKGSAPSSMFNASGKAGMKDMPYPFNRIKEGKPPAP